MSIPAYQLMLSEVIASTTDKKRPVITIPTSLLKFLIQAVIGSEPFDEAGYLIAYPDIAQAISNGAFVNGQQHFLAYGYFEGRLKGAIPVDEAWYRTAYPDIDAAIRAGEIASATDHYHEKGMFEWRAPRADAVAALERWKTVLRGGEPPLPTVARPSPAVGAHAERPAQPRQEADLERPDEAAHAA